MKKLVLICVACLLVLFPFLLPNKWEQVKNYAQGQRGQILGPYDYCKTSPGLLWLHFGSGNTPEAEVLKEMEMRNLRPATIEEAEDCSFGLHFTVGSIGHDIVALGSVKTEPGGPRSIAHYHLASWAGGMRTDYIPSKKKMEFLSYKLDQTFAAMPK